MPAPTLVSSDPADTTTGVSVEKLVTLTFSTDIQASSITPGTVQIFRADDQVPLIGAFAVTDEKVVFVPNNALHEDTLYKIVLIGSDKGLGFAIKSTTGDMLATSVTLSFRTGTERFVSLTEIASRDDIERVGPIRSTDPLAVQPSGGALTVDELVPDQFECNVSIDATGLHIDLSETILSGTVTTSTVKITQSPALGIDDYYGRVASNGECELKVTNPDDATFVPPTGELRVEDDKIVFEIDPSGDFLNNTEVRVIVTTSVQGITGATLEEELEYFFTTEYFPLFISPTLLRVELGPAISTITDDTLKRIIHKNSIHVWEESGRMVPLKRPTFEARRWVTCQSIIDILGVLTLSRDLREGQSKTLGDLSISQRPASPTLGAKYKQAEECLKELQSIFFGDTLATVAVKGRASGTDRQDFRMRTWDHLILSSVGAANMAAARHEKNRLGVNYALAGKPVSTQRFFLSVSPASRFTSF